MTIQNINQIQPVQKNLFGDYGLNGVSPYGSEQEKRPKSAFEDSTNVSKFGKGTTEYYSLPISDIKNECRATVKLLSTFVDDLSTILSQVNLDPYSDPTLEESHRHIWNKLNTGFNQIEPIDPSPDNPNLKYPIPNFVPFEQYKYAAKHACRGCRTFINKYDQLISTTTFGHIYSFREITLSILNEAKCIQRSLDSDFGDLYEDESQQQIATHYLYWLKMATHYKGLFERSIPSSPVLIPESEVDQISKKQAAQFQTFFSIRVNSETVGIDNQLQSLRKDLIEDCDNFYSNFLSPALKFKTKVGSDLALDFRTTNMRNDAPRLAEEAVTAVLAIEGNFKSLLTDLFERKNIMIKKIDSLYQSILLRRKYVLYISQLSAKAITKNRVVTSEFDERYVRVLQYAVIDRPSITETMKSSHSLLDDLDADSHPQYLLKSGGTITGDIYVDTDVTIDGVDISSHSHNGFDGSVRIKSTDIDYDSAREDIRVNEFSNIADSLDIKIDSYVPDILDGGVPVVDTIISINVPDNIKDRYDFEIMYLEL
jgi:hypothetical protein